MLLRIYSQIATNNHRRTSEVSPRVSYSGANSIFSSANRLSLKFPLTIGSRRLVRSTLEVAHFRMTPQYANHQAALSEAHQAHQWLLEAPFSLESHQCQRFPNRQMLEN